ncbi:MAG: multifunctional 2',3'-cyclic-nucleotide 2'-phosphodiesterase/5'-nucleotidase/3'-nucleotidase [Chloroflexi bacterium]|nr:multifunctional 2',3'-cyclic-nucleotide 2'-phosphodiesterase/5'-nucleotidase/3'-nucleotidase [Chloroflexota bacterium]
MLRKMSFLLSALVLALVAATAAAQDDTFELTILHTNDSHSHHEPNSDGDGGIARQATVMNQIRGEVDNLLLLSAGDRFTGTLFHQQYRGADQIQIMNLLGYDALVIGNHEFDDGEELLEAFVQGVEFPVLSANVDYSAFPGIDEVIEPFTTVEVAGEQIGVIGLTTEDSTVTSNPNDAIIFDADYAGIANAAAAELAEAGVNKIVLLTHIGISFDLDLLPQLEGIDVVLGGHSHTLLANRYADAAREYPVVAESATGEPIIYAQVGSNNVYLGRMDLEFDADGLLTDFDGDAILLSRYITPDAEVQALVEELAGPIEALRAEPIGAEAAFVLDGDRTVCRLEECHLGNIITDALIAETGADIAIQNGGGIRADIDAGEITLGEVLTVLPFGNLVSTLDLTGADIVASLENGVSRITVTDGVISRSGANGRFPQVSNLRYSFDPTQEPGSRIVSVEVLNDMGAFEPIDPEAVYSVATNDFMRAGGDGYELFETNAMNAYDFGRPLDQVVAEFMALFSPVSPEIEGRITIVNAELEAR